MRITIGTAGGLIFPRGRSAPKRIMLAEIQMITWCMWNSKIRIFTESIICITGDAIWGQTHPAVCIIDLQFRHPTYGVHHIFYGGNDIGANPALDTVEDDRVGAYWFNLNPNSVSVYRRAEDEYAHEVRIRIWHPWKPDSARYDSLWKDISPDTILTVNHNISNAPDTGVVDLQYRQSGGSINQRYFGGMDFGSTSFSGTLNNNRTGAYWYNFGSASVTIKRRAEDIYAEQVRLRIWIMSKPDYDSGWVALGAGSIATELDHNLGGDAMNYLLDFQYRSPIYGINSILYGGADFGTNAPTGLSENDRMGAYWRTLSNSSVYVYRRPEDLYAPEVRIRIWRTLIADYDSNWTSVNQDNAKTLTHNVGGNNQLYFVNMVFYDTSSNYTNQRHYGGMDFGANPPLGYLENDRVGAYWRSLTSSSISVYRRPEDGFADNVRVRIWQCPPFYTIYQLRDHILGRMILWDRVYIDGDVNGDSVVDIGDIIYYMIKHDKSF